MEKKSQMVEKSAYLYNAIIELGYSLNTRGGTTFVRELVEMQHAHLALANAVLRGNVEEAEELATFSLERSAENLFLIQQVAEVMEHCESVENAYRSIAKN